MAGQLLARSGNLKSFAFNLLLKEIKNKKIISFIIFDNFDGNYKFFKKFVSIRIWLAIHFPNTQSQ